MSLVVQKRRAATLAALLALSTVARAVFGVGSVDATGFDWVGKLNANGVGSGTVVGPHCVLTARHNTANVSLDRIAFTLDHGSPLAPIRKVEHPVADLTMLIFSTPFGGYYAPSFESAVGSVIDVVGYGRAAYLRPDHTGFDDGGFSTNSVRRSARNVISDKVEYSGYQAYRFDYDSPFADTPESQKDRFGDGGAIEREGGTRRGDSGGAYLRTIGGELRLVGVHTAGLDLGGPGTGDSFNADFGDASVGVALCDYREWVVANCVPEPASILALAAGGLAVLARKRRSRR